MTSCQVPTALTLASSNMSQLLRLVLKTKAM